MVGALALVQTAGAAEAAQDYSSDKKAAEEPKPAKEEVKPQYKHGEILIPASSADEATRPTVAPELAEAYPRDGALAWSRDRSCVACHTTGTYLVTRPSLTAQMGRPLDEIRDLYVAQLRKKETTARDLLQKSTQPGQVVYIAAGLAEWDVHVTKRLSPETGEALALMLEIQLPEGGWANPPCWPPFESDAYHLATQAAMALAAAPDWVAQANESQRASINRLKAYLRNTPLPHDYARTLLLWAAARMPDLITAEKKDELIAMLSRHQRTDGGWSIRTFAEPEAWGNGLRAERLRTEPDFASPASDGHQTGLAIVVLREAGVPMTDPRIRRGIAWLKENQRESGRWWTRSLNTDKQHFINYSGTAYPLMALALCGELG